MPCTTSARSPAWGGTAASTVAAGRSTSIRAVTGCRSAATVRLERPSGTDAARALTSTAPTNDAEGEVPASPSMPWRISHVRIQDFRVIEHACVHLTRSTVLLGANNTGKSAVLQAMQYALRGGRPELDDLRRSSDGTRADRFVLDLRFDPWSGADDFPRVVRNRYVQAPGIVHDPPFVAVRVVGKPAADGTGVELSRDLLDGWSGDRAAAEALTVIPDATITQLMWALQHFELLGPSRDLDEQTRQRRSHLGQAVADLRLPATDAVSILADLDALSSRITASSPALSNVQAEIHRIGSNIDGALQSISVSVLPPDLDDLGHQLDVRIASHGGPEMPLRLQGHGARSLAAIAVFQALTAQRGAAASAPVLAVTALEEPEAHLHPQAHDAVLAFIRGLIGQTVVSTHSPYIARGADITDLRVLRCDSGGTTVSAVPALDHRGRPPFDEDGLAQANRFLRRHCGEALFARLVVLIEGPTEQGGMPVLATHCLGATPEALGVSLLSLDGADSWVHYVTPLHHLGVQWLLFLDGDKKGKQIKTRIKERLPSEVHDRLHLIAASADTTKDFEGMLALTDADTCRSYVRSVKPGLSMTTTAAPADVAAGLRTLKRERHGRKLAEELVAAGSIPADVTALFDEARKLLGLES